jgi:uncharacterized membrane protein
MTKVKHFYKNDRLNKGYSRRRAAADVAEDVVRDIKNIKPDVLGAVAGALPDSDIISRYEEMNPGTIAKLLNIAEMEQKYQYDIAKINLELESRARFMGAVMGLFIIAMVIYASVGISRVSIVGSVLFASVSFLSIVIAGIIYRRDFKNY